VRLYRVTKSNPPSEEDMMSYWALGRRPPRDENDPRYEHDRAAYEEVSAFVNAERAARKAQAVGLGEYVAELDVPDDAPMSGSGYHRGLRGTSPDQLLGMVRSVQSVDELLSMAQDAQAEGEA
jgi:hypothetical protein